MKKSVYGFFLSVLLLSAITVLIPSCKKEGDTGTLSQKQTDTAIAEPDKKAETSESVQDGVDSLSREKINEKRTEIVKEAMAAIRETENALTALDNKKPKEALAALEKATGKLELILAREPDLALAPLDVNVSTRDMLLSLDAIKSMRKDIEKLMDDGEIQKARRLISNLGSEIVISVVNIPLASYPKAIKAVSPLIDKGKIEEAKIALANALGTLVIADHIIPLPVVRAEEMLKKAEMLAKKENRSNQGNDSLATLLTNSRYQLQLAESLGYGDKKDYATFYKQLDEIENKTGGGKSGEGFFDNIKKSLVEMKDRIFK